MLIQKTKKKYFARNISQLYLILKKTECCIIIKNVYLIYKKVVIHFLFY